MAVAHKLRYCIWIINLLLERIHIHIIISDALHLCKFHKPFLLPYTLIRLITICAVSIRFVPLSMLHFCM